METKPDLPAAAPAPAASQRIGTIIMATAMVEASWKTLMEIIGLRFFPFAIHVSPEGTKRAYVGFCDDFDEIGPDETPPRYVVDVKTNPRGGRTVVFEKVLPMPDDEDSNSAEADKNNSNNMNNGDNHGI